MYFLSSFLSSLFSSLENAPEGDETTQWCGGAIVPLPFAIYGLMCIINRAGAVPGRRSFHTDFFGIDAIILGIACLSFAALLHFHYFWGLSENANMRKYFRMGKSNSLLILIASLAWVAWCLLRGFTQLY